MLGGLFTSFLMELLIYPIIFYIAKTITLHREHQSRKTGGGFPAVAVKGSGA
jgi:hypothetical protein